MKKEIKSLFWRKVSDLISSVIIYEFLNCVVVLLFSYYEEIAMISMWYNYQSFVLCSRVLIQLSFLVY